VTKKLRSHFGPKSEKSWPLTEVLNKQKKLKSGKSKEKKEKADTPTTIITSNCL
jgi:hypothetical protein